MKLFTRPPKVSDTVPAGVLPDEDMAERLRVRQDEARRNMGNRALIPYEYRPEVRTRHQTDVEAKAVRRRLRIVK